MRGRWREGRTPSVEPELRSSSQIDVTFYPQILAKSHLDKLKILNGYDLLDHLENRFTENYRGESPFIDSFQHADSWRDANQCLQLCDLLTGSIYQQLVPAKKKVKLDTRDYLIEQLVSKLEIAGLEATFWRQYSPKTLNKHFSKFSIRHWRPDTNGKKKQARRKR